MSATTESRLEKYERLEKLGEGTYGSVYKAIDKTDMSVVALKRIMLNDKDEYGVPASALREVALLQELSHPNIVKLFDVITSSTELHLVLEYVYEDLRKYMQRKKALPRPVYQSFLCQLLQALEFCHIHRILHRDLKPENLLIDSRKGLLKLADFGLARVFRVPVLPYTHEVVTLWYRAPEVLLGTKRYACPLDIWAVGCIFAEMASGKPLFPGDSEVDQLMRIFRYLGTPTEETWPGVSKLPDYKPKFRTFKAVDLSPIVPELDPVGLALLKSMLVYVPAGRITAGQALHHPFFASMQPGQQFLGVSQAARGRPQSSQPPQRRMPAPRQLHVPQPQQQPQQQHHQQPQHHYHSRQQEHQQQQQQPQHHYHSRQQEHQQPQHHRHQQSQHPCPSHHHVSARHMVPGPRPDVPASGDTVADPQHQQQQKSSQGQWTHIGAQPTLPQQQAQHSGQQWLQHDMAVHPPKRATCHQLAEHPHTDLGYQQPHQQQHHHHHQQEPCLRVMPLDPQRPAQTMSHQPQSQPQPQPQSQPQSQPQPQPQPQP